MNFQTHFTSSISRIEVNGVNLPACASSIDSFVPSATYVGKASSSSTTKLILSSFNTDSTARSCSLFSGWTIKVCMFGPFIFVKIRNNCQLQKCDTRLQRFRNWLSLTINPSNSLRNFGLLTQNASSTDCTL